MDNQEKLSLNCDTQERYKAQAKYLRDDLGITTVEKAVEYMQGWLPTQVFDGGIMKGDCASVMLTCAMLGQAIEPCDDKRIAMSEATVGWDVYYALKDAGLW